MLNRRKKQNRANQRPNVANENDTFRATPPGGEFARRFDRKLPDYVNVSDDLLSIGSRLSGGVIEVDFPTGDFVYRGLAIMIEGKATSAITGVTAPNLMAQGEDGRHYVKSGQFGKLISRVRLEADGIEIFDFESWQRFVEFLRMFGWDGRNDDLHDFLGFGWPNVFRDGSPVEALYALGTNNIRDLRLKIYTSNLWKSEMQLRIPVWYAPVRQNAAQVISRQTWSRTLATAGKHVIDDIRIDKRIWRIVVTTNQAKKITDYRVEVGDIEWQAGRAVVNQIEALKLSPPWGTQTHVGPYRNYTGALTGVGACLDLRVDMEREGLAIAPLTSEAQRRRDDRLKIELETASAGTEVMIEVYFADRI